MKGKDIQFNQATQLIHHLYIIKADLGSRCNHIELYIYNLSAKLEVNYKNNYVQSE